MNSSAQSGRIAVAVIGAGAFGRNHARVYRELEQQGEPVHLAAIVDSNLERAKAVAQQSGAVAYGSLGEMLADTTVRAASVAVPTVSHLEIASELMESGVDVLIEKPLASTVGEADKLIRTAERCGRIVQVGHLERFNPAVQATLTLLTQPMFFEVHRLSMFSPRSLDVDVVLDLMIHDLDIVLTFVKSPVKEIRAVGLPILSPKVDIANVRVEFDSGCVANFTASRVSTEKIRKLRLFQPRQYLSLDYSRQDVTVFTVEGSAGSGNVPKISMNRPAIAQEEPLHAELRAFLAAVRREAKPAVTLQEGRRALSVALDILAAIGEHSRRAALDELAGARHLD